MAIESVAIRTAIIELATGAIGTIRNVDSAVFAFGAFTGQPDAALLAKTIKGATGHNWFNVTLGRVAPHASTSMSAKGNRRIVAMPVTLDIWTHTKTSAQEQVRVDVLNTLVSDIDDLIQALHYPSNLAATRLAVATTIIGGLLVGPGNSGAPVWSIVDEDWKRQVIHSRIEAAALVTISQAVA